MTNEIRSRTFGSRCLYPTRWLGVRFVSACSQDRAFPDSAPLHMTEPSTAKPYRLTVKAIILDGQQRCLLVRRSTFNQNFVGCWEWPGGKVDDGEDFATALLREAREETGLAVQITGLAGATAYEMAAAHIVLLCMETCRVSGKLRLSEEHDDLAWVPFGELAHYQFTPGVGDFMLDYTQKKTAHRLS